MDVFELLLFCFVSMFRFCMFSIGSMDIPNVRFMPLLLGSCWILSLLPSIVLILVVELVMKDDDDDDNIGGGGTVGDDDDDDDNKEVYGIEDIDTA